MFTSYGRYWAETLWTRPKRLAEIRSRMTIEGLEHVRECQRRGQGMIGALPHVGCWEVAGLAAHQLGIPLVAVAEDLPNPRLTEWFVGRRQQMQIEVQLTGQGPRLLRELAERLQTGGMVALLSDRDLSGTGVRVQFFGEETTIPAGPAWLAVRTGSPILPIASYFRPSLGHRIVVRPPLEPAGGGSRKEQVRGLSQRLVVELEKLITEEPEQWHLFQPNWPSDRSSASSEALNRETTDPG